jgi:hypothetical protein
MSNGWVLPEDERLFATAMGFPRLKVDAILEWLREDVPDEQHSAATYALSRRWLNRLSAAMAVPHAISESPHFLLLTVPKVDAVRRTLLFLEETRTRLLKALASAQPPVDRPKHVVIIFGSKDDYERFTAAGYPEHEQEIAVTGGMFQSGGVPHIMLPSADLVAIHATLVHELVHDCVSHLNLPAWLDEGITQMLEFDVVSWAPFQLDRDTMAKHAAHWNGESIQDFWSGRSFHLSGDTPSLSYNLAVVLVRKILTDLAAGRDHFWLFVQSAKRDDAGDSALREHMGATLEELVADFLGPGSWTPKPDQPGASPGDR